MHSSGSAHVSSYLLPTEGLCQRGGLVLNPLFLFVLGLDALPQLLRVELVERLDAHVVFAGGALPAGRHLWPDRVRVREERGHRVRWSPDTAEFIETLLLSLACVLAC